MNFNTKLMEAFWPHVESFNTFADVYIKNIPKVLEPIFIDPLYNRTLHEANPYYTPKEYLMIYVAKIALGRPSINETGVTTRRLYPHHCRNAHTTYAAPLHVTFNLINSSIKSTLSKTVMCGMFPVMVRSNRCNLYNMASDEIVEKHEDRDEAGGYFIINGNERVIRYIIQQRCNYPICIRKQKLKTRDIYYTENAVMIRSQRLDGSSTNNILYHTSNNECMYRILLNRQEWVVSFWLLLKALIPLDMPTYILKKMFMYPLRQDSKKINEFEMLWQDFVENDPIMTMIDTDTDRHLHALGRIFWDGCANRLKPGASYADCGQYVINKYVLTHIDSWNEKLMCLVHLFHKLQRLREGSISVKLFLVALPTYASINVDTKIIIIINGIYGASV